MSLLKPKVVHLWPTPPCGPCCSLHPAHAIPALAARTHLAEQLPPDVNTPSPATGGSAAAAAASAGAAAAKTARSYPYLVSMHPVLPWAAYVMESLSSRAEAAAAHEGRGRGAQQQSNAGEPGSTSAQLCSTFLVVQHILTGEVLWNISWIDVAAILYGEENSAKLPAACKSLGTIQSLQFWDPHILYWSGMIMTPYGPSEKTASTTADAFDAPSFLLVQTTHRCLVLRLLEKKAAPAVLPALNTNRRWTRYLIRLHVSDQTHGAVPTSNLLGISPNHYLVGCVDGSLKCFCGNQVIKSIKGLGKGDWIVRILSANSFQTTTDSQATAVFAQAAISSGTPVTTTPNDTAGVSTIKRILTCTKRGSLYLIEIEIKHEPTFGLDIRPPLARFALEEHGGKDKEGKHAGGHGNQQHATIMSSVFYDAHRNWVFAHNPTTVWVWNLTALQNDLLAQQMNNNAASSSSSSPNPSGGRSNLLKPDPTLTIHHFLEDTTALVPIVPHSSFSSETVVCGVTTADGELYLQGAVAHPNNPVSSTYATPVQMVHLPDLIQEAAHLDDPPGVLAVRDIQTQVLGPRPVALLVTNLGLIVLEWQGVPLVGSRHLHLGAGLGSLGKSVLSTNHSDIIYGSLDVLKSNPLGSMVSRNPKVVYESPPTLDFADVHKRPFRLVPLFLPSPSGSYVALWWPSEFRYEILHAATLLQKVGKSTDISTKPAVARGFGILCFAWLGDEDHYALLHAPDVAEKAALKLAEMAALTTAAAAAALPIAPQGQEETTRGVNLANLKNISALGISGAKAAANVTLTATKAVAGTTLTVGKGVTTGALNVVKVTGSTTLNAASATINVTKGVTSATMNATKAIGSTATKAVSKTGKKIGKTTFGIFKRNRGGNDEDNATGPSIAEDNDADEAPEALSIEELQAQAAQAVKMIAEAEAAAENASAESKRRWVEVYNLEAIELKTSELGIAPATSASVGEMSIRGANSRNPPAMLFSGPVLCVATRSEEDGKGQAHFYTRKPEETKQDGSVYVSSGPTLPFPDLVAWDDDGRLCAVVVKNRVAIYLSNIPDFVLLGMVSLSASSVITSVKFVHGALFTCTWNSVHCTFLGDLDGGVCNVDTFPLASAAVPIIPEYPVTDECVSLTPPLVPLPLAMPVVLGYQSGSLVVSTIRGIQAIPLAHPLLRIGTLLAAGQVERATKWFDAVSEKQHEALANFLLRRGHSDLALALTGVSLETVIDISMQYGYVERLEEVVEDYGVKGLRAVDMGRGVTSTLFGPERDTPSIVVCVGAYLLAHGRVELTRQLATELVRLGEDGKKDALFLAALLMSVDENDASRLVRRTVEDDGQTKSSEWIVGEYVRKHVL